MFRMDWSAKAIFAAIAIFLGLIALRPFFDPAKVEAQTARFDHVYVVSPMFLYKGQQGLLVMDKRNGNIWFFPKGNQTDILTYADPVFVLRLPFEKLDQAPR